MQSLNLPYYSFRIKKQEEKHLIFDPMRKKFVALTPEEWVRQHFVMYLVHEKGCPQSLISLEAGLKLGKRAKRTDVVVYDRQARPLAIVECKAPAVSINSDVFEQIIRYNMSLNVKYIMLTNGLTHYCCRLNYSNHSLLFLEEIPDYNLMLKDTSSGNDD